MLEMCTFSSEMTPNPTNLYGRCVDLKLFEYRESFLVEFAADGDVCDVGGVVVVEAIDVLHDATAVGFDRRQDQQVLEIPGTVQS